MRVPTWGGNTPQSTRTQRVDCLFAKQFNLKLKKDKRKAIAKDGILRVVINACTHVGWEYASNLRTLNA